tara:strand:+ start:339 stop:1094 length:756 start_codon:yes stop_codon:yes gene_type:complete
MAYSPRGEHGQTRAQVRATEPINERVGGFLRFLFGPVLYNQGVVDARTKAMERGSRIPGLPEFGLSEGFKSYFDQAGSDLKTAFDPQSQTAEPELSSPTQRFDNTLEGQYQRYFQTPEMDYVFGAGARGKDAPKDASAMEILGNQLQAPAKDTNISSMYAAQSAMGRVNEDAIQKMYEGNEAMQTWAKANPMLAQREYLKAQKRIADQAPLGLDNETAYRDLGTRAQYDNPMGQEAYARIKKGLMNKSAQK